MKVLSAIAWVVTLAASALLYWYLVPFAWRSVPSNSYFLWVATVFGALLLIVPATLYLLIGWIDTRNTTIRRMKGNAIQLYFDFFPAVPPPQVPANSPDPAGEYTKAFERFYNWHFGVRRFAIPVLLYWTAGIFSLVWSAFTVDLWLTDPARFPATWAWLALAALSGAYMRTVYDQITDAVRRDLSPGNTLWAAFRIMVAIPIGYSLSTPLKSEFGPALAFLLGFFPTRELFMLARRFGAKRLDFGEVGEHAESELQAKLQGVDQRQAERFADARVTTVLQLAYSDPVKLSIRGNLELDYVIDCVSQALLWIYIEGDVAKIRKLGFRGAQEAQNFYEELMGMTADDPCIEDDKQATDAAAAAKRRYDEAVNANSTDIATRQAEMEKAETAASAARLALRDAKARADAAQTTAEAVFAAASKELNLDPTAFKRMIREVAEDPFVELLHEIWSETC